MPLTTEQFNYAYDAISTGVAVIEKRADNKDWLTIALETGQEYIIDWFIGEGMSLIGLGRFVIPLNAFLLIMSPTAMGDGSLPKDDFALLSNQKITLSGQDFLNKCIVTPKMHEISGYKWPAGCNLLSTPNVRETGTGHNWTPLHVAVHHGDWLMAKALLKNGALILKDKNGHFPSEVNLWSRYASTPDGHNKAKALILAVAEQGSKVSNYAWPKGHDLLANPNIRETSTGHNWTPLHVAVHHGDWVMVKALLDKGALILKDKSGFSPHEVHLWSRYASTPDGHNKAKALIQTALILSSRPAVSVPAPKPVATPSTTPPPVSATAKPASASLKPSTAVTPKPASARKSSYPTPTELAAIKRPYGRGFIEPDWSSRSRIREFFETKHATELFIEDTINKYGVSLTYKIIERHIKYMRKAKVYDSITILEQTWKSCQESRGYSFNKSNKSKFPTPIVVGQPGIHAAIKTDVTAKPAASAAPNKAPASPSIIVKPLPPLPGVKGRAQFFKPEPPKVQQTKACPAGHVLLPAFRQPDKKECYKVIGIIR